MHTQPAPDPGAQFSLATPFYRQVLAQPARPALWIEGVETSYAVLGDTAARIAGWLHEAGISRGDRVGVLATRSQLAYAGILGACWAGATFVPLHPKNPEARLLDLMRRAELGALIVDGSGAVAFTDALLQAAPARVLTAGGGSLNGSGRSIVDVTALASIRPVETPRPVGPDDLAYLMFTSGTTGEPKGVMVKAEGVAHFLQVMQARYRIEPEDRCSQFFELTFDVSVFDLFMTWGGGACLYSLSGLERLSPAKFVRDHALTVWCSVPSAIAFMVRVKALGPGSLPSLRLSLFCGEALPAESVKCWRAAAPNSELENLYGPTEATIACLLEPCGADLRVTKDRGTVAIGTAIPGTFAAIVDRDLRFLPPGEVGELVLAGVQLAAGYWRDGELSASRFVTLEHPEWGARTFYLTHDLALQDGDGHFHFLGRIDNQIKLHGHRVELEEIEAHLLAMTGSPGAAIAWPVKDGSPVGIVAFVTTTDLQVDEIQRRLAQTVPWYMLPRRVVSIASLPLTPNGKTDRQALSRLLQGEPGVAR